MSTMKAYTEEEIRVYIESIRGPHGEKGEKGDQGERGERGLQGIPGAKGDKGDKGDKGERGAKGDKGDRGEQGLPGRDGANGRDGATGPKGADGAQGQRGEKGEPGEPGKDGIDGEQGFSPIVDLERVSGGVLITVQNKEGNKIAKVNDGARGPAGEPGEKGERGSKIYKTIYGRVQNTDEVNGKIPPYIFYSSGVEAVSGDTDVHAGDVIWFDGMHYPVVHVADADNTPDQKIYVESGESIKGETGAQGPRGAKGEKGDKGDPGTAVPLLSGTTSEISPTQVYDALTDGKNVIITHDSGTEYGVFAFTSFAYFPGANGIVASVTGTLSEILMTATLYGDMASNTWTLDIKALVDAETYAHEVDALDQRTSVHGKKITQLETDVASIKNGSYLDDLPADKLEMLRGPAGADGAKGDKGDPGETGPKGDKGDTGEQGPKGDKGDTGAAGAAGYTPVKGTDYYTAADKQEMVSLVLNALPAAEGVTF